MRDETVAPTNPLPTALPPGLRSESPRTLVDGVRGAPARSYYWSFPWVRSLATGVSVPKSPAVPWLIPSLK
jgi:hypothetical protein